jgi:regulatory protein
MQEQVTTKRQQRSPAKGPTLLSTEQAVYDYAVRALGRRMRTVAQLKLLLRRRVERSEPGLGLIDAVVQRLLAQQYLSDSHFAAVYGNQRKEGPRHGRRRVAQDLQQKGVHPDIIARELELAYAGTSEEAQARAFVARKRLQKPTDQKQTAKLFRTLARAGFGGAVVVRILRQWDVAAEALAAIEEAE